MKAESPGRQQWGEDDNKALLFYLSRIKNNQNESRGSSQLSFITSQVDIFFYTEGAQALNDYISSLSETKIFFLL